MGDFNSRIGIEKDYICNDNIHAFLGDYDTLNQIDVNCMPLKMSQDQTVNNFGRRLLQMCINTGHVVANGRLGSDKAGNLTCFTHMGSSVVDYLLLPAIQLNCLNDFNILDPNEFSDHAGVEFSLRINTLCFANKKSVTSKISCIKWNKECVDQYANLILESIPQLMSVIDIIDDDENVDEAINTLSNALYDIGFSLCGKVIVASNKKSSAHKAWFNHDCYIRKREFCKARNTYKRSRTESNRRDFIESRTHYAKVKKTAIRIYKNKKGFELSNIAKFEPRKFWTTIKNDKSKRNKNTNYPDNNQFKEHYSDLFGNIPHNLPNDTQLLIDESNANFTSKLVSVKSLDESISTNEIIHAVGKLKRHKGSGIDKLIAEMFMDAIDVIVPFMQTLFNLLLDKGLFPRAWSTAVIVPIPKKGDLSKPDNFRAISVSSIFGKIFSSILNTRLMKWSEINDKLNDKQFGFRPGRSTIDCIFILQNLITETLHKKQDVYCAFIDFQKAFDKVNRHVLYYKLWNEGVSTKFVQLIKKMYSQVEVCIKHNGIVSDSFHSFQGVKQGDPLSPILFLYFINDFMSNYVPFNHNHVITIEDVVLLYLLFADDAVLIAKTKTELQNQLDHLRQYCIKWDITVNINKTKVVLFTKKRRKLDFVITYGQNIIEIVDSFVYLGVLLHKSGNMKYTQKRQSQQGEKALCGLKHILDKYNFRMDTQCNMFDSLVSPVLNYASEIWGFHLADDIEKVHIKFCRKILQLSQRTPTCFLYGELNRTSMSVKRKEIILKYWLKIITDENTLIYKIYNMMRQRCEMSNATNWASQVRDLLFQLGLNNYWYDQDTIQPNIMPVIQRLHDQFRQSWHNSIQTTSKLRLYTLYKVDMKFEKYLYLRNCESRKLISLFRSSTCKIEIEEGRFIGTAREDRLCQHCTLNVIEDEYHFIMVCPKYRNLRLKYFPKYFTRWPTVQKFTNLISSDSLRVLSNLGLFLKYALTERTNNL